MDLRIASVLERADLRLFGVARARPDAPDAGSGAGSGAEKAQAEYRQWIHAGLHGTMEYLARHAPAKYDPERVLPGCSAVIVVGCNYYQRPRQNAGASGDTGRVARYAWGRDYHNALGKRLARAVRELRASYPGDTFRSFVDASPLSERFFAERAGIGYTARNTLTISSAFGSWFFLGEILTTMELSPTPATPGVHGACPSGCFRCGSACPTGALHDHYRIDARRCISYLTIEHRGSIPEELREPMGDWVFGCDLCQETCPLNVRATETRLADFTAHRTGERLRLVELLAIEDDDAYRARFAGTPLLRPGRDAMVRNACVAAGNTGTGELTSILTKRTHDRSAIVREHAVWAIERMRRRGSEKSA